MSDRIENTLVNKKTNGWIEKNMTHPSDAKDEFLDMDLGDISSSR